MQTSPRRAGTRRPGDRIGIGTLRIDPKNERVHTLTIQVSSCQCNSSWSSSLLLPRFYFVRQRRARRYLLRVDADAPRARDHPTRRLPPRCPTPSPPAISIGSACSRPAFRRPTLGEEERRAHLARARVESAGAPPGAGGPLRPARRQDLASVISGSVGVMRPEAGISAELATDVDARLGARLRAHTRAHAPAADGPFARYWAPRGSGLSGVPECPSMASRHGPLLR
jgi:hypothetical protein